MTNISDLNCCDSKTGRDICVVRLRTTQWSDCRGVHIKKSLVYLRRLSHGYNLLEEEVASLGAPDTISGFINLNNCPDGVYTVETCNISRDWESGHIDSYDLKLVPYKPTA